MSINWVMLTRDGEIVPMPNEKILYTSRPRVGLEITTPAALQVPEPFTVKSNDGLAYITNERVIYLPTRPTEGFRSFSAPILNFQDTDVAQPWFGPWSWTGVVRPVASGGVPTNIPRLSVKLIFKEGGHYDFRTKFNWLKERLNHARELGLVPAENIEPPPPYEAPNASASTAADETSAPATSSPLVAAQINGPQSTQPAPSAPDEPPPDYAEAQSQAVAMQLEEQEREEAERH